MRKLLNDPQCIALGEVGLHYHHARNSQERQTQQQAFAALCDLATEVGAPLVLHLRGANRDATIVQEDAYGIMKNRLSPSHPIYFHYFGGSADDAGR